MLLNIPPRTGQCTQQRTLQPGRNVSGAEVGKYRYKEKRGGGEGAHIPTASPRPLQDPESPGFCGVRTRARARWPCLGDGWHCTHGRLTRVGDFLTICLAFSRANFQVSYKRKIRQHYCVCLAFSFCVFFKVRIFQGCEFGTKKLFHNFVIRQFSGRQFHVNNDL